eukprot:gb/GECG01016668.1/.p1 GENE.gb/GECG01016668.1/~~gb/GECG01016668.1/.p1  ORF type:complete len:791 (+),score=179.03 gb/GECG01016668.1/:1-2373(+)
MSSSDEENVPTNTKRSRRAAAPKRSYKEESDDEDNEDHQQQDESADEEDYEVNGKESSAEEEDDGGDEDASDEDAKKPAAKKRKTGNKNDSKSKTTKKAASSSGKKKAATTSKTKKSPATKKSAAKKQTASNAKSKSTGTKKSTAQAKSKAKADEGPKTGKVKELKEQDKLKMAMKAHKWWDEEPLEEGLQWRYLEHLGVCFAEPYEPHGVKMNYDGEAVDLTPAQEEMATFYAGIALDGPQLGDPKVAPIFQKNFFSDFKKILGKDHKIQKFEKCDFEPIREHLRKESEKKKNMSKEEKEQRKEENQRIMMKFGYALVDSHLERVGAYKVEPPGLFRGRGVHPKTGMLKERVMPEDITLNIAELAAAPPCPIPGHSWKRIVHDPTVTWLAYWKENIMGNTKYVFLAASSSFKGKSDRDKYEKARKLKSYIGKVKEHYERALKSKDDFTRQCGTAMWVIDNLALRAGGEKDEDEADTVGCCSLRVEHLTFAEGAEGDKKKQEDAATEGRTIEAVEGGHHHCITFDFLGKDSMRYYQTIDFDRYGEVGVRAYKNIKGFCEKKEPGQDVFDKLTPGLLNTELQNLMPGLSAKVFRTYNASITLEQELPWEMDPSLSWKEKKLEYDRANRAVAILCNHQRTPPKSFEQTYQRLANRVELTEKQVKDLKKWLNQKKKNTDIPLRGELPTGKDLTEKQKEEKQKKQHMFQKQPSADQLKKRLDNYESRHAKLSIDLQNKDENKQVALGTSKINYMDPRITVAWCKAVECPIEKVFPAALLEKFPWAMSVPSDFKF